MNIRERLGKELLFLDGGMGTLLQAEGLAPGELPETWNIEHPEKVEAMIEQRREERLEREYEKKAGGE